MLKFKEVLVSFGKLQIDLVCVVDFSLVVIV